MATRRGDIAKQYVIDTIAQTFKDSFVCIKDKKIYLNIKENQEIIQIAISLTVPKVQVQAQSATQTTAGTDWRESTNDSSQKSSAGPVSLSPEDEEAVRRLMEKLGVED